MSLILENLYLGSVSIAKDIKFIKDKQIKYILICAKGLQQYFTNKVIYKQINISDNPCTIIIKYIPESIEFIYQNIQKGAILVHCLGGKSRSVTIIIAYIMFKLQITYEQGYQYVKQKHFEAQPNPGFIKQLKIFEQILQAYGKHKIPNFQQLQQILIDNNVEEQVANKLDSIKLKAKYKYNGEDEESDDIQIVQK